jgi:hypothetical protein
MGSAAPAQILDQTLRKMLRDLGRSSRFERVGDQVFWRVSAGRIGATPNNFGGIFA